MHRQEDGQPRNTWPPVQIARQANHALLTRLLSSILPPFQKKNQRWKKEKEKKKSPLAIQMCRPDASAVRSFFHPQLHLVHGWYFGLPWTCPRQFPWVHSIKRQFPPPQRRRIHDQISRLRGNRREMLLPPGAFNFSPLSHYTPAGKHINPNFVVSAHTPLLSVVKREGRVCIVNLVVSLSLSVFITLGRRSSPVCFACRAGDDLDAGPARLRSAAVARRRCRACLAAFFQLEKLGVCVQLLLVFLGEEVLY